jgi:flagellar hook-associated protein 3 FlgL
MTRISSFAAPLQQEYLLQSLQTQLNTLTTEVSSGTKANPALSMGSDAASLYRLHAEADQQSVLQTTATTAGSRLDVVQGALTSMATAVQSIATATINSASADPSGQAAIATQASSTMAQVLNLLNTQYNGSSVFAGDATTGLPMQSADAPGGPQDTVNAVLNAAVTAKGGPLTASDGTNLLNGPNGLSSVFDNSNSNPAQRFNSAFYTAADDGKPTKVLIGLNQTVQYSVKGNQPAFTDLMKGLSMLSMLSAPSTQLDATAKSAILQQATTVIGQAQNELTTQQGQLGVVQSQLQQVVDTQQAASNATTQQISNLESPDPFTDAEKLSALQTQLQASYQVTSQISQLTLSHYLPALTG